MLTVPGMSECLSPFLLPLLKKNVAINFPNSNFTVIFSFSFFETGWSQTYYVDKEDCALLILLSLPLSAGIKNACATTPSFLVTRVSCSLNCALLRDEKGRTWPQHNTVVQSCAAALGHTTHPAESSSLPDGFPSAAESSPKPGGSWGPQRDHPSARDNTIRRANSLIPISCPGKASGWVVTHTIDKALHPLQFCPRCLPSP